MQGRAPWRLFACMCICGVAGQHTEFLAQLCRSTRDETRLDFLPIGVNRNLKIYFMLNCALMVSKEEWDNKKKRPWFNAYALVA